MNNAAEHPAVVIISTLAALVATAASVWGAMIYVRKKVITPMKAFAKSLAEGAAMLPFIKRQLTSDGTGTLREIVIGLSHRVGSMEAREQALMQEHDMGIFISDSEGRTLWVNRTYCRMLGIDGDEAIGLGWKNSLAPAGRAAYIDEWNSAVLDRREFTTIASYVRIADPSPFSCRVCAFPLFDTADKQYKGHLGLIEPVTHNTIEAVMGSKVQS